MNLGIAVTDRIPRSGFDLDIEAAVLCLVHIRDKTFKCIQSFQTGFFFCFKHFPHHPLSKMALICNPLLVFAFL